MDVALWIVVRTPTYFAAAMLVATGHLIAGCFSFDLNDDPTGQEARVEAGDIAVDPRRDNVFVIARSRTSGIDAVERKQFVVIPADEGPPLRLRDVSASTNVRMLFAADDILLFADNAQGTYLMRLNGESYVVEQQRQFFVSLEAIRLSADGRWLVASAGTDWHAPLQVIDTTTLSMESIPHDGEWLQATWARGTNTLLTVVFYDGLGEMPRARLLAWNLDEIASRDFAVTREGYWQNPVFNIPIAHTSYDIALPFHWIGVSSDDRWLAVPVLQLDAEGVPSSRLLVLDVPNGAVHMFDHACGRAAFTSDATRLVARRCSSDSVPDSLLLIDTRTLRGTDGILPAETESLFVPPVGNYVVATGRTELVLYDLQGNSRTTVATSRVPLTDFVTRLSAQELYSVDDGRLHRIDLRGASAEDVSLSFTPLRLNIQVHRDQLVMSDEYMPRIHFWSPERRALVRTVELPAD